MVGTYALYAGYYDAYYLKAQQGRSMIRDDFVMVFEDVDIIMGPTAPTTAFKLGDKADDPVTMYLSDTYTIAVNLAGLPAMSVPAGMADGLPVGLQLIGNYFEEGRLLNAAHRFLQVTDWHTRMPAGFFYVLLCTDVSRHKRAGPLAAWTRPSSVQGCIQSVSGKLMPAD